MTKFRGFIAVDITNSSVIDNFRNALIKTGEKIKPVKPENMHITLKFLGDTPGDQIEKIEDVIKKSIEGSEPFNLILKSAGFFPDRERIRVVWIGLHDNGQLAEITGRLNEGLAEAGFKKEKRPFSPHLTIARVKSLKNKNRILQVIEDYSDTFFIEMRVSTVKLIKSELKPEGPRYTVLKEVKIDSV